MTNDVDPRVLTSVDETRRDIVRRLVLGSAFVLPAIASFPMDSLAQAQAPVRTLNTGSGDVHHRTNPDGAVKPANPTTIPGTGNPAGPARR
ncbi:hypothetical protein [Reyranella sp.]|uniref:hypothetical protein n=1 Tax=Reyranella sp. TaxID=1929291 RepID=UPI0027156247|nr:hypothetical protein [Reyranella sp.]MDO8975785.1 hypothetical protein [Reyranella sp.]